jgi:hypothetical protein
VNEVEGQDVAVLRVEPLSTRPAIEKTLKSREASKSGKMDVSQAVILPKN